MRNGGISSHVANLLGFYLDPHEELPQITQCLKEIRASAGGDETLRTLAHDLHCASEANVVFKYVPREGRPPIAMAPIKVSPEHARFVVHAIEQFQRTGSVQMVVE